MLCSVQNPPFIQNLLWTSAERLNQATAWQGFTPLSV